MPRLIALRLANLLALLVVMTFVIFAMQELVPADPARAALGFTASKSAIDAKRKELELDLPMLTRYGHYLSHLVRGDLGQSVHTHRAVTADLVYFLPASIELMAVALVLGIVLGVAVALVTLIFPRFGFLRVLLMATASAPIFLSGLLLSLVFWYWLGWLPGGGRITADRYLPGPTGLMVLDGILTGHPGLALDALRHLALPALTLALPVAVAIGRTLDSSLASVFRQNYIRTARAKGLTESRILRRHALRNAAGPPVAMVGLQVALMFSNLAVVEQIFSWPGLGLYLLQSFAASDLPAVLGVALVFAIFYLVMTLLIDLAQIWLDPRINTG